MNSLYPKSPEGISSSFTKISKTYKRGVWIAFFSLCIFVSMYLLLVAWFVHQSYYLLSNAIFRSDDPIFLYLFGACSTLISLFLLKGLFFVKKGTQDDRFEINEQNQPELVNFINTIADEAGAPRPYRIFLSEDVNACVFYNLSVLDVLFPTKKNLEIGLGLVNVLTLGELKAVIAHEFGHFSQRSMLLGNWVYVAQQIALHFVHQRDAFDRFLKSLDTDDLRLAWIGWSLNLLVWSLRSILEIAFRLVILAQRSLSREMEMHADKVAVSLTGSDELIHALHKLGYGDTCWEAAFDFAHDELLEDRLVEDIFEIQTAYLEKFREIYGHSDFYDPPELPDSNREDHRVFQTKMCQPPKMWATHPSNFDRERNAKSEYVYVELDQRSSWEVFYQKDDLKKEMTKHVLEQLRPRDKAKVSSTAESLQCLNDIYDKEVYKREYRGTYIGRGTMLFYENPQNLYRHSALDRDLPELIEKLYPQEQSKNIQVWRSLRAEKRSLQGILDGSLTAIDGVIRHRNEVVSKDSLPDIIDKLDQEIIDAEKLLVDHDKLCRTVHREIAASFSEEWKAYIVSLVHLLHFAEHGKADLLDAFNHLRNEYRIVNADGKIDEWEYIRLIEASEELRVAIYYFYEFALDVKLPEEIQVKLGVNAWADFFAEELGLPPANEETIMKWLDVAGGWYESCIEPVSLLRQETLETLLKTEKHLRENYLCRNLLEEAPKPAEIPKEYCTLTAKDKRHIQKELGLWDRFILADGLLPSVARTTVAMSILFVLAFFNLYMDTAVVLLYNSLDTNIVVTVADQTFNLGPDEHSKIEIATNRSLDIVTKNDYEQLIEKLTVDASNGYSTYVYNVAGLAIFRQETVMYKSNEKVEDRVFAFNRWNKLLSNTYIKQGPKINRFRTRGPKSHRVLYPLINLSPDEYFAYMDENQSIDELAMEHIKWDSESSKYLSQWFDYVSDEETLSEIVNIRLERSPTSLFNLRNQQIYSSEEALQEVCRKHNELYDKQPSNLDYMYLKIRCIEDRKTRREEYKRAYLKHSTHPMLSYAASYAYMDEENWKKQVDCLLTAYDHLEYLRPRITSYLARLYGLLSVLEPLNKNIYLTKAQKFLKILDPLSTLDEGQINQYKLLKQGRIQEAIELSVTNDEGAEFLRMAAASDGAPEADIQKALLLKSDMGTNLNNIWFTIGLHLKNNKNYDLYLVELLEENPDTADTIRTFIEGLKPSEVDLELEKYLKTLDLSQKGYAYSLATIALGDKTPKLWRDKAKALLFETERPYFR